MCLAIVVPNVSHCPADPMTGGGELVTAGAVETAVLAPVLVEAGLPELPAKDAVNATLEWWGGCGVIVDCAPCPPKLVDGVNASSLRGKILIYDLDEDVRLCMCGLNRIARGLGGLEGGALAGRSAPELFRFAFDRSVE